MFLYKVLNHHCSFFQRLICVINKTLKLSLISFEPGAVLVLPFDKVVAVGFAFGGTGFETFCDFRITDFMPVVYVENGWIVFLHIS